MKSRYSLTPYQVRSLSKLISVWHEGDYIYPGHVKSKTCIEITQVYNILETFKEKGYVDIIYEIYCTGCSRTKGKFITTLSDIDENTTCDFCNKTLNTLDDTIALYKVIKEGE